MFILSTYSHDMYKFRRKIDMVSTQSKDSLKTNSDWQAEQPYNELASLPPSIDVETKAVLKQCIEARAKLAELKQASMLIPNDSILINLIPLLEAKDSSEIENIVTTTTNYSAMPNNPKMPIMLLKKPSAIVLPYIKELLQLKSDLLAPKPLSKSAKPSKVLI